MRRQDELGALAFELVDVCEEDGLAMVLVVCRRGEPLPVFAKCYGSANDMGGMLGQVRAVMGAHAIEVADRNMRAQGAAPKVRRTVARILDEMFQGGA